MAMTTEPAIRFMSRAPARTFGIAGLIVLGCAAYLLYAFFASGDPSDLFSVAYLSLGGAWMILVFLHRLRPVLEIAVDKIIYGSIFDFRRRLVPVDAVEAVGNVSRLSGRLPLRLRSGKVVRIPLRELGSEQRARAVEALRQAVSARGAAAPPS
jgi:hypothetical protein